MRLGAHLTFGGNCEEAFHFYAERLGGQELTLFKYGATPAAADVPPAWHDKIVHGSVTVGGQVLSGADVLDHRAPEGWFLLLSVDDRAEAERVFAALSEGGEVRMPLAATFWSPAFGVVIDRFGVPWEISSR